jgi:hypothetical protein
VRVAVVGHDLEDAVVDGKSLVEPSRASACRRCRPRPRRRRCRWSALPKPYTMTAAVGSLMLLSRCPRAKVKTSSTTYGKSLVDYPCAKTKTSGTTDGKSLVEPSRASACRRCRPRPRRRRRRWSVFSKPYTMAAAVGPLVLLSRGPRVKAETSSTTYGKSLVECPRVKAKTSTQRTAGRWSNLRAQVRVAVVGHDLFSPLTSTRHDLFSPTRQRRSP